MSCWPRQPRKSVELAERPAVTRGRRTLPMQTGRFAKPEPESRLRTCVGQPLLEWLRRTGGKPQRARRRIRKRLPGQTAETPTAVLVAGLPAVVGPAAVAVPAVWRRCRVPSLVPTLANTGVGPAITPGLIFVPRMAHRFAP